MMRGSNSDLVAIEAEQYTFVVWAKEVGSSQKRLQETLRARGKSLVSSTLLFSPALKEKGKDTALSEYDVGEAVFFENKQYDIEFVFDESLKAIFLDKPPVVEHRLKAVEESFHYSYRTNSLRATINTGNDIGWFTFELVYSIGSKLFRQSFSFEVLPTKIDMASDLKVINEAIDSQFPLWRFSLAEKTQQQMQGVKKPHPQFLLLWLAQFEALLDDLQSGLTHIVNAPHSRLMSTPRTVKMDRLKGRLSPKLEQKIIEAKAIGNTDKRFTLHNKKLSIDTPENRFIKSVVLTSIAKLSKINNAIKNMETKPDKQRLSNSFFNKLNKWHNDMRTFQRQPLFKEVGSFKGLRRESLVLQQKPGYAKVYKAWQQLKWYLDLLEGDSNLSLRSVSELYEIWCFLEVRRIILELGFDEVISKRAPMINSGVTVSFKDGMQGTFIYKRDDGVTLRLAHEPQFKAEGAEIKSWTTTQKPDIFLEATFLDGKKFVWLFDAKYRIKLPKENNNEAVDLGVDDKAPDDAINQMHRYRDALIHIEKTTDKDINKKTRPVLGAYALYPGFYNQANKVNPYAEEITQVGIGAFSLLPTNDHSGSVWLTRFLSEKLAVKSPQYTKSLSDKYFVEEAPRIAYLGTNVTRYSDLVIAANQLGPSRDTEYIQNFRLGQAAFYHTKQLAFDRQSIEFHIIKEAQYLAVAVDSVNENSREIRFIYPILTAKRLPRCDITAQQSGTNNIANADEPYWLFELGKSLQLHQKIILNKERRFKLKLIGREDLSANKGWDNLVERYTQVLQN